MTTSAALAQTISQLLRIGKEVKRLIPADCNQDILAKLRKVGYSVLKFFGKVKSSSISGIPLSSRPEHILNHSRVSQHHISEITPILYTSACIGALGVKQKNLENQMTGNF